METARYIYRCNMIHQSGVVTHFPGPEALTHVAIQVNRSHFCC
jgi:hypothetical protein